MNRAMAPIEFRGEELRRLPVLRAVLEQDQAAGAPPAEDRGHQVEVAVAIEISGAHVGDTTELVGEDERLVGAVLVPPQPHDGAVGVIGGLERAEVTDQQVLQAVLVEVDPLDVRGMRDSSAMIFSAPPLTGVPASTSPARMSEATTSGLPSPSRSRSRTFAMAGCDGPGRPASCSGCRSNMTGALPVPGHGACAGSNSGAAPS